MNHSGLVKELALRLNLTQQEVKRLLQASINTLSEKLHEHQSVPIPGLGTFSTTVVKEKKSFNVATRKFMLYPPKRLVRFNTSSTLKNSLPTQNENYE